jgi:hypothetical protein
MDLAAALGPLSKEDQGTWAGATSTQADESAMPSSATPSSATPSSAPDAEVGD